MTFTGIIFEVKTVDDLAQYRCNEGSTNEFTNWYGPGLHKVEVILIPNGPEQVNISFFFFETGIET